MSTAQCRISSVALKIEVVSNPLTVISTNTPVCEGGQINLSVTGSTASWTGPGGLAQNGLSISIPEAQQTHSGKYYVTTITNGCTRLDSTLVTVLNKPHLFLNKYQVNLCTNDSIEIIAEGADQYRWSPATFVSDTTARVTSLYPKDTTLYQAIGMNNLGCTDTASVLVNVVNRPKANAGPDKVILQGTSTQLLGSAKGDSITYQWWPDFHISQAHLLSPTVNPGSDTIYILKVNSGFGCGVDEDTVKVRVLQKLGIPNAFSPNNDGINDLWQIKGIESYADAEVSVFNKYGQQMFSSRNFSGWDGKVNGKSLPWGTYYYIVTLRNGFSPIAGWLVLL